MASGFNRVGSFLQNVTTQFLERDISFGGGTWKTERLIPSLIVIFLLTYIVKYLLGGRLKGTCQKQKSFHKILPRVQWTWFRLPLLDGFVNQVKLRNGGMKFLEDLRAKYGRTFVFSFVPNDVIFVSDPEILKKFLSSNNPGHLNKPKFIYEILFEDIMKDGIVVVDYDVWSVHRKAISKAFTYNSFPTYLKLIHAGVETLIQEARSAAATSGSVHNKIFAHLLEHHSLTVTTAIIMGSESFNMTEEDRTRFAKAFLRSRDIVVHRVKHPQLMLPPIWMFHKKKREFDQQTEIMNSFTCKMINNYRNNKVTNKYKFDGGHLNDTSVMGEQLQSEHGANAIDAKEENHAGSEGARPFDCMVEQMIKNGHSNKEIVDAVNGFLIAGNETLVTTMNMLLFHLAANMKDQEICRQEVDQLFDANTDLDNESLTMQHLSELKYLERCILESLRLTPTAPMFLRRVDVPLNISDDCVIEAGNTILVCSWALHRNPEIYPNPTKFDPDRFLPENVKERHSHAFIPFSMGARNCIGWKVALLEMKVYTAHILRNFEITTTDRPEDVRILYDVTINPERLYNLNFKLRKHS